MKNLIRIITILLGLAGLYYLLVASTDCFDIYGDTSECTSSGCREMLRNDLARCAANNKEATSTGITLLALGAIGFVGVGFLSRMMNAQSEPTSQTTSPLPGGSSTAKSIAEQLAEAKKLFDEGLIDETEYKRMREKIIDSN